MLFGGDWIILNDSPELENVKDVQDIQWYDIDMCIEMINKILLFT